MSVLQCDKHECPNVMCDRLSNDRQEYLCEKCFEKLVRIGPNVDLDAFMRGCIADPPFNLEASRAYFDSVFPKTHQGDSL